MWHDERTRTGTDRMKQLLEQTRAVDPTGSPDAP